MDHETICEMIKMFNFMQGTQYYGPYTCELCRKRECMPLPFYPVIKNEKVVTSLCFSCAYLKGYVSEKEYLQMGVNLAGLKKEDGYHAVIKDGAVHVYRGDIPPWELPGPDDMGRTEYMATSEYREWRKYCLRRDKYRCQKCGYKPLDKKGLHVHHVKPYALYPNLRVEKSNGITLCEDCHKEEHKKR
jgi:HNH endonuclease